MVALIREMEASNQAYLKDPAAWTADSAPVKEIADYTGADAAQVPEILSGYTFLPIAEQVGPKWLGGSAAKVMKSTAEFLKSAGRIDSVQDDYAPYVNDELIKAAAQ